MARLISRLSVETDRVWEGFELGTTVYLMLFKRLSRCGYDTSSWSWTLVPASATALADEELTEWTYRIGMFYTVTLCDPDEEVHKWKLGKNRV